MNGPVKVPGCISAMANALERNRSRKKQYSDMENALIGGAIVGKINHSIFKRFPLESSIPQLHVLLAFCDLPLQFEFRAN